MGLDRTLFDERNPTGLGDVHLRDLDPDGKCGVCVRLLHVAPQDLDLK